MNRILMVFIFVAYILTCSCISSYSFETYKCSADINCSINNAVTHDMLNKSKWYTYIIDDGRNKTLHFDLDKNIKWSIYNDIVTIDLNTNNVIYESYILNGKVIGVELIGNILSKKHNSSDVVVTKVVAYMIKSDSSKAYVSAVDRNKNKALRRFKWVEHIVC